jgi:hypothetical protein
VIPNFFLVGAPKAGTTSLYQFLGQHPEIYLSPIKEPGYFAGELRPENFRPDLQPRMMGELRATREFLAGPMLEQRYGGFVVDWTDYLRLFVRAENQKAIGEGSVHYLWSPSAARNIAARIPGARILMLLRDPSSRAYSQYLHGVTAGVIGTTFREHVELGLHHGPQFDETHPFLELGMYSEQISRYLEAFPREQVLIRLYEDYRDRKEGTMREVLEFLGVDPTVRLDTSGRHREARVPRNLRLGYWLKRAGIWQRGRALLPWRLRAVVRSAALRPRQELKMEPEDRSFLVAYYRADIEKLAKLIGRDLSAWLR